MKKILISLGIILSSFFLIPNVHAATTAKITISPSSKTVIVGNTFTATVTVSSSNPIAALDYTISGYDSALTMVSTTAPTNGARNIDTIMNNNTYSKSYTYTFKAKKSGVVTLSITGAQVNDSDNKSLTVSTTSSRITVMTQTELEATYSKNNNLSSLTIEGYELDPVFNKNTTEYNVTLKPETELIKVSATKEDNTASIIGTGDIEVTEGLNIIKVEVTAQNGNIKTYIINATVEELDPIELTINDKKYTVVRSKKAITFTNNLFNETTISIKGEEVPAFYNEMTNTTIICVKDEEGNVSYLRVVNDEYYEYKDLSYGNLNIMLLDPNEIPYGYISKEIEFGEKHYTGYVINDTSRFVLIYGINLENGNKGFYSFDNYENTLQRFDMDALNIYKSQMSQYQLLIYILGGLSIFLFICLLVTLIFKIKHNKKMQSEIKNIKNKMVNDEIQEEKQIKEEKENNDIIDEVDKIIDSSGPINNEKAQEVKSKKKGSK